jgi:glycosyltransferase involved in cell wall biosynthesis
MNVLLLSRYSRSGNSSRVRSYQYLPYLRREGIHVTEAPLSGDDFVADLYAGKPRDWASIGKSYIKRLQTLSRLSRFDLLWIERELFPYVPALAELLISMTRVPYVIDFDDAIFHNYDQNRNPFVRGLLGKKIGQIMRHARLVVVGNSYLQQYAEQAGAPWIEQLPSVVDSDRLYASGERELDTFTIGWIGTPLNADYLHPIQTSLAETCADGKARVVLVGSGEISLQGLSPTIRPWTEADEANDIGSFDVGIMPLPDAPWERGKCGYKLLQYFACGLPVVASPVGVNRTIVEDSINGFLASGPDEWSLALQTLLNDPEKRQLMGNSGRKKVEREYSISLTAPKLVALLRRAAGV